ATGRAANRRTRRTERPSERSSGSRRRSRAWRVSCVSLQYRRPRGLSRRRGTFGEHTMSTADIGLIGLAVMGENLVLNIESRGYTVAVFNRTTSRVDEFLGGRAKGKNILGTHSLSELVSKLKKPRKVMLMVQAGPAVDAVIGQLAPLLEPGDVIIDGGNS